MITGNTPKHTISHRESICIPKLFSSSVLSFLVLATLPSNASNNPDIARQHTAHLSIPQIAHAIPITDDARLR